MSQPRKLIVYGVLALVALFVGIKIVRAIAPVVAKARLKSNLAKIEPWAASTNYSEAGWQQLIKTARRIQNTDPQIVDEAFEEYLKPFTNNPTQLVVEQGKIYLLLRVVFDAPENGAQRIPSAQWDRGGTDLNPDDTINEAWPVIWNGGKPRLAAGRFGSPGSYSVKNEYSFMRFRYKYRELSKAG
jgi:hypothetical protein